MDNTITTEAAGKRMRRGNVILTDRLCEKRVTERIKYYDRKCPGLYVSITTAGVATFSFKFTDPETGKQRTGWLGVFNPETFTVEDARSKVYGLRGKGAAALAETFRDRKVRQAKRGKTVDEIIEERIDWMKTLFRKPDGGGPGLKAGKTFPAICGASSTLGSARRSRAKSPSTTLRRSRTTSWRAKLAFRRSPMPGICGAPRPACSTGRRKRAAIT